MVVAVAVAVAVRVGTLNVKEHFKWGTLSSVNKITVLTPAGTNPKLYSPSNTIKKTSFPNILSLIA